MFNVPGIKEYSENYIKNDICPLCESPTISVIGDPTVGIYEFKCVNCNPNITIGLTDSFITDVAYITLLNKQEIRNFFRSEIKTTKDDRYAISTDKFYPRFAYLIDPADLF